MKELYLLDNYNHAVLIDGGDGTFDYLYVRKFNNVWSRQEQGAYNFAGSNIFDKYKQIMLTLCDDKFLDTKLFYMIYEEIKKHLAQTSYIPKAGESGGEKVVCQVTQKLNSDSYGYSILFPAWHESNQKGGKLA